MDDLDFDRELQSALTAEPSPEFVARVRARIAEQPRPSLMAGRWKPAVAAACVAVMIVAIGSQQENARRPPSPAEVAPSPAKAMAGLSAATRERSESFGETTSTVSADRVVAPAFRSAKSEARRPVPEPPMPEVIVAPGDIKALREFLTGTSELRFVASFDPTPAPTPWLSSGLGVPADESSAHNN